MNYQDITDGFQKVSTENSYSSALVEYMSKKVSNASLLINIINEALLIQTEYFNENQTTPSAAWAVSQAITKLGYNSTTSSVVYDNYFNKQQLIPTSVGYVQFDDFAAAYIDRSFSNNSAFIKIFNLDGSSTVQAVDIEELIIELTGSMHASVSILAAVEALEQNDFAARITVFRDKLSQYFNDAYEDVSGYGEMILNSVKNSDGIVSFLTNLKRLINLDSFASNNDVAAITQSDFYKYAGVNPITTLCADTIFGTVGNVISMTGQIFLNVVNTVIGFTGKLLNKIGRYIYNTTVNPYDIEINSDTSKSFAINDFHYHSTFSQAIPVTPDTFPGYNGTQSAYSVIVAIFDPEQLGAYPNDVFVNKTYQFELKTGILNIKPTSASCDDWDSANGQPKITISGEIDFRPYPVSAEAMKIIEEGMTSATRNADNTLSITRNTQSYRQLINAVGSIPSGDFYATNEDSEKELLAGFVRGFNLSTLIGEMMYFSLTNTSSINSTMVTNQYLNTKLPGTVYNKHFVTVASGYNFTDETIYHEPYTGLSLLSVNGYLGDVSWLGLYTLFIIAKVYTEVINPLLQYFVPYLKNRTLPVGKYRIRTDAQNIAAFQKFASVVSTVVIITAVVLTGTVLTRAISRKITNYCFIMREKLLRKVQDGESLSAFQLLQLKYSNSLLAKQGLLTGSLRSSANTSILAGLSNDAGLTADITKDIKKVSDLIK